MKQEMNFNPKKPKCPRCRRSLKGRDVDSIRYDDLGGTMIICICLCGAATGYVVLDKPKPNDPYIIQELPNVRDN